VVEVFQRWWGNPLGDSHLSIKRAQVDALSMALRIKRGHFLHEHHVARLTQLNNDLNGSDSIAPHSAASPELALTNGLLLDIYCWLHDHLVDLGSSSITNRLADILYHLGCSPPRTQEIARRWNKEATKLYDTFIIRRKTTFNRVSSTVHLAALPTFHPLQTSDKVSQHTSTHCTTRVCSLCVA